MRREGGSEDPRHNLVTNGMVLLNPQLASLPNLGSRVGVWDGSFLTRSCSCVLDLTGEPGLCQS